MCYPRIMVVLVIMMSTASGNTESNEQSLDAQKVFQMFLRSARDTATIMQDVKMVITRMDRMDWEIANLNLRMDAITTLLQNVSEKLDSVNQPAKPQDCTC